MRRRKVEAMAKSKKLRMIESTRDENREERISMEILVDAHDKLWIENRLQELSQI